MNTNINAKSTQNTIKYFIKLLPPSLAKLINQGENDEAIARILRELQIVTDDKGIDRYTRNSNLAHLYFQLAVISNSQKDNNKTFEYVKQSFQHDAFAYPYHHALIMLALTAEVDEAIDFACEVAMWFWVSYEYMNSTYCVNFWSEDDQAQLDSDEDLLLEDESAITTALETYRHVTKIEQCLLDKSLLFARIDLHDNSGELPPLLTLIDEYRQKGLNNLNADQHQTAVLFKFDRYADIVALWGNGNVKMTDNLEYVRLMVSRIFQGVGLPDTLELPNENNASNCYSLLTIFMDNYNDALRALEKTDKDDSNYGQKQREHDEFKRLVIWLGEHTESLHRGVEQGEITNGYANNAHVYAMLCRNYSNVNKSLGDLERALNLSEKGFSLSPFIENGRAMVNEALKLKQYERAQKNIDTVRLVMDDYLDFYSCFHLDSRELHAKSAKSVEAYFEAEKSFKIKHNDFLHNMRVNAIIDSKKRPKAVIEWTDTHNICVGNFNSAVKVLFANYPENTSVIAHYFEVQALTGNRSQVEWSKTSADHLKRVREDKSHPDYKENYFKALAGLGYLKLRQGDYEEDKSCYREGISLLEKALNLRHGEPRARADCYFKIGRYLHVDLEEYENAEKALSQAIDLLEIHGTKADDMAEMEFIGDPLLSLAYWYRGAARDNFARKRQKDNDIAEDFVKFCTLNDCEENYLGAYEVAYLLAHNKPRLDVWYAHAMNYIDAIEEMQPDFEARGNVMSMAVLNLLLFDDKERAKSMFEAFKKDFPDHDDLPQLERNIANLGKRKRFLGIF